MIVQSHRGAGKLAPDNTMEAFELAWSMGTIPEADVRTTSDGILVAFHDNTLENVAREAAPEMRKLAVSDLAWADVSTLDVGSWMGPEFAGLRVPRVDAIFDSMRGREDRMLYLDVKDLSLAAVAALAREHGVIRQMILASTHYALITEWSHIAPESGTLLWLSLPEERIRRRMDEVRAAGFEGITQLQFHVRVGDLTTDDPFEPCAEYIRQSATEIRGRGILFQALPFCSDSPEAYHRLIDLGVESFASDDPGVAVEALRTHAPER